MLTFLARCLGCFIAFLYVVNRAAIVAARTAFHGVPPTTPDAHLDSAAAEVSKANAAARIRPFEPESLRKPGHGHGHDADASTVTIGVTHPDDVLPIYSGGIRNIVVRAQVTPEALDLAADAVKRLAAERRGRRVRFGGPGL